MSKEGACSVVVKVLFLWLTMLSVGLWFVACVCVCLSLSLSRPAKASAVPALASVPTTDCRRLRYFLLYTMEQNQIRSNREEIKTEVRNLYGCGQAVASRLVTDVVLVLPA